MGWGATNDGPDIAEMAGRPNRLPPWTRRVGIAGGIVLALLAFFLVRQLESDVELVADPPRYSTRHLSATDVRIDNPTGETKLVILEPPERIGLRLRDVNTAASTTAQNTPTEYVAPPHTEITLTLRWQPTDCAAALERPDGSARLALLIGTFTGAKERHHVRLGGWRDLVPPACDDFPDRGVPRMADQPAIGNDGGLVAVRLTIENAGGQPLRLAGSELPDGVDPALIVDTRPRLAGIGIGNRLRVALRFQQNDCRAPDVGPATVVLRFETPTTGRVERLRLELADSWPNLIGTCVRPSP